MAHPYLNQPATAKWSRSVSRDWRPGDVLPMDAVLLRTEDQVASLGSCFAANMVPYLRRGGFSYIAAEQRSKEFEIAPPENFSYDLFSAAYGNIYTARQFRQLLDRAFDGFRPAEDRWHVDGEVIDPFRPGLRFRAKSNREFDALTNYHLSRVRHVFETADVVIFTLGLTEAWTSGLDGSVFPACPGTVAGTFDPQRHLFKNFGVGAVVEDLDYIVLKLQSIRPGMRMILTVSPVPLVATATQHHVVVASTYSKSVLRAACGEMVERHPSVAYFPSYEIITGPQAPADYFEPDRRSVSTAGIDAVMAAFLEHCVGGPTADVGARDDAPAVASDRSAALSSLVNAVECEEAAADVAA